ncbi:hypothetical protein ACFWP2_35130 [Kitasatospora sp. NPDC058444]|uniref:hypothetical protein n=1 Tax=Kitasatospora sp. NPDC058444 TaxID=3346504 RepID=UPI003657F5D2
MTETEQPTDPRAPTDGEQVCGHCRTCGQYGLGTYDGQCGNSLYDWIINHVGCHQRSVQATR